MRPAIATLVLYLSPVLALSSAACGDEAQTPADPEPVALADYCGAWAEAACASVSRCGCALDGAACAMVAPSLCPLSPGAPARVAIDEGSVAYDPVAGARAIERLRSAACTSRPLDCGGDGVCFAIAGEGGACETTRACADGLACAAGACTRPRAIGATCAEGLECESGRCAAGVCAVKAELGAACDVDGECATGRCDFATGRCRDLEPLDGLCTRDEECATGYCERVELRGGNCRASPSTRSNGAPCAMDLECLEGACVAGACAPALCDEVM